MSQVTKPIILDETGRRMAEAWETLAGMGRDRVVSLDNTVLSRATIEAHGTPVYVSDVSEFAEYGIADTGWYVFARIMAPRGELVTAQTIVIGAAGCITSPGADHIDVAVHFGTTAESQIIDVFWEETRRSYAFTAYDLAIRNLDYRTTFYVYDAAPYATWSYAPATEATFAAGTNYYLRDEETGAYSLAEVTVDAAVPTYPVYYKHSKVRFEGLTKNITYKLDEIIDCPSEFVLPVIDDDDHGAWFELRLRHAGSYSSTLIALDPDVRIATEHTQTETAGVNMINLHYAKTGGYKVWRFMNTHSTIPEITISSVTIAKSFDKRVYTAGEALDTTGFEARVTLSNGYTTTVGTDEITFSPADGTILDTSVTNVQYTYTRNGVSVTNVAPIIVNE